MRTKALIEWCERLQIPGWEDLDERVNYMEALLEYIRKTQTRTPEPVVSVYYV